MTDGSKSGVNADITQSPVRLKDIKQEKLLRASTEAIPPTVHTVQASY